MALEAPSMKYSCTQSYSAKSADVIILGLAGVVSVAVGLIAL
jgi:hypothetical protein